ncbi:hypothetical protein MTAT_16770 [Moorella thermoacetica]|uniref:Uncharacterized protein n=1 Tax=Neomoorella thermoacetica TaxID=1525 RepID=A0AAC9MU24_NEOTH|nr:hypothetical protein [Moorella thermoacetica]AOQ23147.1 hypothetical protein Maut_00684 [Moorella thermoacetica]TYL12854.1 hypothetical protein MTAT_16770 [Moorella thermoacetica]
MRKQFLLTTSLVAMFLATLAAGAFAGATPWIQAAPRPEQNLVHLEWGMNPASETGNYNYMVYKREAGEAEFQSIPVKDRVKVLNIYPPVGDPITFTNWKGQRFTLPKAASLKKWMEEPNAEHPKGYGMGLIEVDAVSVPNFNANPAGYLKNPDGSWKYDVIFNGSWDVNADYDLNANSLPIVEEFIRSGHGYLTGHDTMFGDPYTNTYTRKLRRYFRIKIGHPFDYWNAPPGEIDYKNLNMPSYPSWVGSTTVKIVKKGLLTNYPWKIGEPGTVLNVPFSHSTSQYAFGDVWLVYTNDSQVGYNGGPTYGWQMFPPGTAPNDVMNPGPPDDPNDPGGTNNFYLTTWSNTAMVNTGHSNCEATPDEQKIIANTLFYLAQVTNGISWDDHSAQDVAPPNPVAGIQTNPVPGGIEITWQRPKDNGNTYYYYVQAINKATGDRLNSAVVGPVSYATGIKGYAYVIDQNPSTDPRAAVNLAQEKINVALAPGKYYLHIRAVDNVGNASEVKHFTIEVGFELQAALEPNPAMRGQKVRVYAAVQQSGLNAGTQSGGSQEFHPANILVQHRNRPSFWQPWGTDFTDPDAWWIWPRDTRGSGWQTLAGETAEFRKTWNARAWGVYRTEVCADNWFHLYQDGNLVLKGGGMQKAIFTWEQAGDNGHPDPRPVPYKAMVVNGGGPAGLLLNVREVGRHWTTAYQPEMPGDGVSHHYYPDFYVPNTQTVMVRVRNVSGNQPDAVYIDDHTINTPGVARASGGDLTFTAQGGHWYHVNVWNSYSKGVDRFDVRVTFEGSVVVHTDGSWESRNLPVIGYGNAMFPVAAAPGAEFTVNVPVHNLSGAGEFTPEEMSLETPVWKGSNYDSWCHIQISYHWYDQNGNCVIWDDVRTELPQNISPGETVTVPVKVIASTQPGTYTLRIDAVQEDIAWFSWAAGPVLQGTVQVDPGVSGVDYSSRVQADQVYVVLPDGSQLPLQWDAVLRRYWGEFLIPDGGSPGVWPGDGTYPVQVVAAKGGLTKMVNLNLVIEGNIKEKLYIRTLEW